ncbi:MAG: SagB/ThcOx family dehydrogenase [Myxococcota bacterium]
MQRASKSTRLAVSLAVVVLCAMPGTGCNKCAAHPESPPEPDAVRADVPDRDEPNGGLSRYARLPQSEDLRALPRIGSPQDVALETALFERRSIRRYTDEALSDAQLSRLLWAAQGVTSATGNRTAPSAGALYPLEVHVLAPDGVFRYEPRSHALEQLSGEDRRDEMAEAAVGQSWVADGAAVVVIGAVVARTASKYGDRAERYAHLEAGAAAQNLLLEVVALELGATFVGAFHDDQVVDVAQLPQGTVPLAVIPVGVPES